MTIYTKGMHHPAQAEDGIRIAVLGRLTENDGITPIPEWLGGKHFQYWMPVLAPSGKLVGQWHRKEMTDWNEFTKQYIEHIRKPEVRKHVELIAKLGLENDITLLCSEDKHEFCHRSLLAEECRKYVPGLEIIHR